jgi:hypothetical protein
MKNPVLFFFKKNPSLTDQAEQFRVKSSQKDQEIATRDLMINQLKGEILKLQVEQVQNQKLKVVRNKPSNCRSSRCRIRKC